MSEKALTAIAKTREVLQMALADLDACEKSLGEAAAQTPRLSSEQAINSIAEKYAGVLRQPGQACIVKPTRWLGKEKFAEVSALIRQLGGEYVSQGKESHWRVP